MNEEEFAYYRAVEDHFAALRGTPFLFSPKDFALLRRWWQEAVPLAAVVAGISEAIERRRAGGGDPVSSLSYCRHAVVRQARRLAASHAGGEGSAGAVDVATALQRCLDALGAACERWHGVAAVAAALDGLRSAVASLPRDASAATLDETLARLEEGVLRGLVAHLPAELGREVAARVGAELAAAGLAESGDERVREAVTVRSLRTALGLPRLELHDGGG